MVFAILMFLYFFTSEVVVLIKFVCSLSPVCKYKGIEIVISE